MFVIAGTVFSVALTWLTMVILGIDTNTWGIWAQVPVLIIPTYVLARLSIILPATAVEKKTSLLAAWRLSRKNGWRLVFTIIYFPAVIFYLPNWVLSKINFLAAIPFDILGYLLSLIGVAALTLSYSELSNRGKLTGSNTRRKKGRRK
jgi:membrane-anchored glycerophosphoryl diester phosphodiesterase (GDPDase)